MEVSPAGIWEHTLKRCASRSFVLLYFYSQENTVSKKTCLFSLRFDPCYFVCSVVILEGGDCVLFLKQSVSSFNIGFLWSFLQLRQLT